MAKGHRSGARWNKLRKAITTHLAGVESEGAKGLPLVDHVTLLSITHADIWIHPRFRPSYTKLHHTEQWPSMRPKLDSNS
jgi:hypothetical protein